MLKMDKKVADNLLERLERMRENKQDSNDKPDHIIRVIEAEIAVLAGYTCRQDWKRLQNIG